MEEATKLKIVFVGNFSTDSVGEPETAWALEKEGHIVVRVSEEYGKIQEVEAECVDADFLLFSKCRIGTWREVSEMFQRVKCPKVAWCYDLYAGI